jgi:UDP-2-acetamido-3-amino-2,3-dideoxy-glucuronate N-acetyltransferase
MFAAPAPTRDLALIGAGDWGQHLARCFDRLGTLARVVAAEDDDSAAKLQPLYPGLRLDGTFADVLGDASIRKVAIAAPTGLHYELAKAALEAGKHVFVEKPLCLRLDQAKTLAALADGLGKTLMVGHLLQYHPCVVKLHELVADGTLGKLLTITSNRLNLGKFRSEENALWSFAPHDVSVVLSLLGNRLPQTVRCVGRAYLSRKVADSTLTSMRFADDVLVQIHVSWLNPFKEQKLTVVGSEGMAVFDDTKPWPEKLTLHRQYLSWSQQRQPSPLRGGAEAVLVPEREPLLAECEHFLKACGGGAEPRTDGHEGVRVLTVLDMAQRSLELDGDAVRADQSDAAPYFAHPSAIVELGVEVGRGTKIWQHCHLMRGARIGERCSFGQNVSIASGVVIGNGVKVQNNVSIYSGVELEDDVFLGPACVLTNVSNPRSQISRRDRYETTLIRRGATVGANATIVCGNTLGRYSFIAAGAVVTKDVPNYALMAGNPARQIGWMSRHGRRLEPEGDGVMVCAESGWRYREDGAAGLKCLDWDEDAPLPELPCNSST